MYRWSGRWNRSEGTPDPSYFGVNPASSSAEEATLSSVDGRSALAVTHMASGVGSPGPTGGLASVFDPDSCRLVESSGVERVDLRPLARRGPYSRWFTHA
jgi:hypothetical protein